MEFFSKKKNFKFDVNLKVEELTSVPFVNAVVYCKLRFVSYGHKTIGLTASEECQEHKVVWNSDFCFPCKMTANSFTSELDPVYTRLSIRRELKGGKSYMKIGYVDLNLAEYAGSGPITRRFLLEGYNNTLNRLDNSILKVTINLTLTFGDLCFKAPKTKDYPNDVDHSRLLPQQHRLFQTDSRSLLLLEEPYNGGLDQLLLSKNINDDNTMLNNSNNSNNGVLRYPVRYNNNIESVESSSRSSSSTLLQSRSNSENAINRKCIKRNSGGYCFSSMNRPTSHLKDRRIVVTRVDADTLVDDVIRQTEFNSLNSETEASGLQLIVNMDGSTLLRGASSSNHLDPASKTI